MTVDRAALDDWNRGVARARAAYLLDTTCPCGEPIAHTSRRCRRCDRRRRPAATLHTLPTREDHAAA